MQGLSPTSRSALRLGILELLPGVVIPSPHDTADAQADATVKRGGLGELMRRLGFHSMTDSITTTDPEALISPTTRTFNTTQPANPHRKHTRGKRGKLAQAQRAGVPLILVRRVTEEKMDSCRQHERNRKKREARPGDRGLNKLVQVRRPVNKAQMRVFREEQSVVRSGSFRMRKVERQGVVSYRPRRINPPVRTVRNEQQLKQRYVTKRAQRYTSDFVLKTQLDPADFPAPVKAQMSERELRRVNAPPVKAPKAPKKPVSEKHASDRRVNGLFHRALKGEEIHFNQLGVFCDKKHKRFVDARGMIFNVSGTVAQTRRVIQIALQRGCIEVNPGPPPLFVLRDTRTVPCLTDPPKKYELAQVTGVPFISGKQPKKDVRYDIELTFIDPPKLEKGTCFLNDRLQRADYVVVTAGKKVNQFHMYKVTSTNDAMFMLYVHYCQSQSKVPRGFTGLDLDAYMDAFEQHTIPAPPLAGPPKVKKAAKVEKGKEKVPDKACESDAAASACLESSPITVSCHSGGAEACGTDANNTAQAPPPPPPFAPACVAGPYPVPVHKPAPTPLVQPSVTAPAPLAQPSAPPLCARPPPPRRPTPVLAFGLPGDESGDEDENDPLLPEDGPVGDRPPHAAPDGAPAPRPRRPRVQAPADEPPPPPPQPLLGDYLKVERSRNPCEVAARVLMGRALGSEQEHIVQSVFGSMSAVTSARVAMLDPADSDNRPVSWRGVKRTESPFEVRALFTHASYTISTIILTFLFSMIPVLVEFVWPALLGQEFVWGFSPFTPVWHFDQPLADFLRVIVHMVATTWPAFTCAICTGVSTWLTLKLLTWVLKPNESMHPFLPLCARFSVVVAALRCVPYVGIFLPLPVTLIYFYVCFRPIFGNRWLVYAPHLVTCLLTEYARGTSVEILRATLHSKALRLATFPLPDRFELNGVRITATDVLLGTEEVVLYMMQNRYFGSCPPDPHQLGVVDDGQ